MKTTITILALCLIGTLSFAQAPAIQWQKCLGGTGGDYSHSFQLTPDGGYIMAGVASSTDGDVIVNHGASDFWVVKLSSSGSLQWQQALGGTSNDIAQSIQNTSDGGYIIAGFTDSTDGDITGYHGGRDAWIVKLSSTGTIQWQKTLGGTDIDEAHSIQTTPDGGYILAGSTQSNDGDVTGYNGYWDFWVVKLTTNGTLVWQKTYGGTSIDQAQSIQPTLDGGYIVAGLTYSTNGEVTGNHGNEDAWVVKISATGNLMWQKTLGGTDYDQVSSIQLTPDGGYILAGFTGSNNGDAIGFHGAYDSWIVKLSATGALEWQKCLGGTVADFAQSIELTNDGGFIVAGNTRSSNGDVTENHGSDDGWLFKLTSTGAIVWQKNLGGTADDAVYNIKPTSDGGYLMVGYTNSIDGDVLGNHGGGDAWVVKLDPELMATTIFASQELKIFPNPAKNIMQLQTATNGSLDKITITDLTGKIILTQTTNTAQINVEPLASGMYILEATSGENKFSSKFVKE